MEKNEKESVTVKSMANMRHEVIENSIRMDNFVNDLIMGCFGLECTFEEDEGELMCTNEGDRDSFHKHLLKNMSSVQKIDCLKDMANNMKKPFLEEFMKDVRRFYEIRNVFAHSLYPPQALALHKKENKIITCEGIHAEHATLYNKIGETLWSTFCMTLVINGEMHDWHKHSN